MSRKTKMTVMIILVVLLVISMFLGTLRQFMY